MATEKFDMSYFKTEAEGWDDKPEHKVTRDKTLKALLDKGFLHETDHVLDFGCGPGGMTCAIAEDVNSIVGVDVTEEMIATAKKAWPQVTNASFIHMHLTSEAQLKEIGAPFDLIVSLLAFHHIPNPSEIIQLLAKALKPGGRLVIFDLLLTEDSHNFHPLEKHAGVVVHGFAASQMEKEFIQAGLVNLEMSTPFTIKRPQLSEEELASAGHSHSHGHSHNHGTGHSHGHGPEDPNKEHPMIMAVATAPN